MKTKIISILVGIVFLGSCTKDWEKMNTNPDRPEVAPSTNIIANAMERTSFRFFSTNDCDEWGGYAGIFAKIQYLDESHYKFREGTVNNTWRSVYTLASDLKIVIETESKDAGNKNLAAVATILRCYLMQVATDLWGDIPYTEACNNLIVSPKYDTQQSIYMDLLAKLKAANAMFNALPGQTLGVGAELMYNSANDAANRILWKRFGNSLRLRMAIRISKVDPTTSKSIVEEILGSPATYPIMTSNDHNALLTWSGGAWQEPYFANMDGGRDDHGMAASYIDNLKLYNDPRLSIYAKPATSDGVYRGQEVGGEDPEIAEISRIGALYRDEERGFSMWMRASEIKFIIAEAALNGWNTNGVTAQTAYEDGITLSCEEAGVSDANITAYLAEPLVAGAVSYDKVYMQKWFSLMKMGVEAWAETRRTDVPVRPAAPKGVYTGHTRCPFRYPYPNTELNLNAANYTAASAGVVDRLWGKKMWWDTRTGVN